MCLAIINDAILECLSILNRLQNEASYVTVCYMAIMGYRI
jgi:hypothetical protein